MILTVKVVQKARAHSKGKKKYKEVVMFSPDDLVELRGGSVLL